MDAFSGIGAVDQRLDIVVVLDRTRVILQVGAIAFDVVPECGKVVVLHFGEHIGHDRDLLDVPLAGRIRRPIGFAHLHRHELGHVEARLGNSQGERGHGLAFGLVDVVAHTIGKRQDRSDADDTDRAREGSQEGAALLGHQVIEGKGKRRHEGHGRILLPALRRVSVELRLHFFVGICTNRRIGALSGPIPSITFLLGKLRAFRSGKGRGVVGDAPVRQADNAVRITLGKFRVVGNHDDQAVLGDFGKKVHHLDAGFRIQGAGRFVSKHDIGVVDERTGNRNALHLTTGKLVGFLVDMLAQTDALERPSCTLLALFGVHSGKRKRQLHVG